MSFDRPLLLLTLAVVPLAAALYVLAQRRSARYAVSYSNLDVLAAAAGSGRSWRRHAPFALLVSVVACLCAGLARPHMSVFAPVERATVVLAIDASRSMQSTDVRPSRLLAAQAAAKTFLELVPRQLRVGLVVFAGDVDVVASPTTDRRRLYTSVDAIGNFAGFGGTAIGDALARAVELGREAVADERGAEGTRRTPPPAVVDGLVSVLFLSDGRQNRGILLPAEGARLAREAGIPVYTVALGRTGGGGGGFGRFNRAPDPETLMAISRATGGEFFAARSEQALASAYTDLGSRLGRARQRREVTYAFVGAAAALLGAAGLLSVRWSPSLP